MLVGQIWATAVSCCYWLIGSESELIELCSSDEADTEEETKKDKNDKFQMSLYVPKTEVSASVIKVLHAEDYLSIHHPEITTPPPEIFLS